MHGALLGILLVVAVCSAAVPDANGEFVLALPPVPLELCLGVSRERAPAALHAPHTVQWLGRSMAEVIVVDE